MRVFVMVLLICGIAMTAYAADISQELYISPQGAAYLRGAVLSNKNALNFFEVLIWGQKWSVISDYVTTFESADGAAITPSEMQEKDVLEIKGHPLQDKNKPGYIEATVIRDLSITKGGAPATPFFASLMSSFVAQKSAVSPAASVSESPISVPQKPLPASDLSGDLQLGMRGENVAALQKFLQKNNFGIPDDGPVTGFFGAATQKALKKFQTVQGIDASGVYDPVTRNAVLKFEGVSASAADTTEKKTETPAGFSRSLSIGSRGDDVTLLQKFLQKHNWGIPSDTDMGYFGGVTASALKKFQLANGLDASGMLGPKTRDLVNSLLKK